MSSNKKRYSLDWCDLYLDELLDKMGSDLFPLPIKLNRFITTTYDFIRETTEYIEAKQEISDDIKPLIIERKLAVTMNNEGKIIAPEPVDYLRLISIFPITEEDLSVYKKVHIYKLGQNNAYERDPFREPNDDYPSVFREANLFKIDVGKNSKYNYSKAFITYVKKPTFATISKLDDRIVNLPDISIEKILLKTADSLRFTTEDPGATHINKFNDTFGKRNK